MLKTCSEMSSITRIQPVTGKDKGKNEEKYFDIAIAITMPFWCKKYVRRGQRSAQGNWCQRRLGSRFPKKITFGPERTILVLAGCRSRPSRFRRRPAKSSAFSAPTRLSAKRRKSSAKRTKGIFWSASRVVKVA